MSFPNTTIRFLQFSVSDCVDTPHPELDSRIELWMRMLYDKIPCSEVNKVQRVTGLQARVWCATRPSKLAQRVSQPVERWQAR